MVNRAGAFRQAIVHAFDLGKVKLEITFTVVWISRWIYLVDSDFIFRFFFFFVKLERKFFFSFYLRRKDLAASLIFARNFQLTRLLLSW